MSAIKQPEPFDLKPKITVVGVGGAGGNAVSNMIRSKLDGVDFMVANTDSQALRQSLCDNRIQLGSTVTKGLGAGAKPDIGRASAEESVREIAAQLAGSNMAFITAGMGGGTGTGAAPVVAQIAREQGILTVGVVTKPFHFEGTRRMRLAEAGIEELQQYVDTLIIIPNQNLFRIASEKTTFVDAFKMADEVLYAGVRSVSDLMIIPGLVNLDFADIKAVMSEMGKAMMGTGEASGENRAIAAAEAAINNPLLDDVSMKGARGILINIAGDMDTTLYEINEAADRVRTEVDPEANIIFGSTFDQSLEGKLRISVVATGIDAPAQAQRPPVSGANLSVVARNPNPQSGGQTAAYAQGIGIKGGQAVALQSVAVAAATPMVAHAHAMSVQAMTAHSIGAIAVQAQQAHLQAQTERNRWWDEESEAASSEDAASEPDTGALNLFIFNRGGGREVVLNFQPGEDLLRVARNINETGIETPEDVLSHLSDIDGNAVIDFGNGDQITLVGVKAADIVANAGAYFSIG
jgi:cell division protein FtsZ